MWLLRFHPLSAERQNHKFDLSSNQNRARNLAKSFRPMLNMRAVVKRGIPLVISVTLSVLLFAVASNGQSSYLPLFRSSDSADLGIAFSNPTVSTQFVNLLARGFDGQVIHGDNIVNPVRLQI